MHAASWTLHNVVSLVYGFCFCFFLMVLSSDSSIQVLVAVEKRVLTSLKSMKQAVLTLIATYFAFNIAYPKFCFPVLLFVQHNFLDVMDKQHIPNGMKIVHSNMMKL